MFLLPSIPHGPDLPVPEPDCNREYSSDYEHSDMTCGWWWRILTRRGRPYSTLDTSRTQRPDIRSETFKGACSAVGSTSQRQTSVGTRNNLLLASRPWECFSHSEIIYYWFITTTLLVDRTNGLRVWCHGKKTFYWLIQQKSQSSST